MIVNFALKGPEKARIKKAMAVTAVASVANIALWAFGLGDADI